MGGFRDRALSETDARLFKSTVVFITHHKKAARISGSELEIVTLDKSMTGPLVNKPLERK